MNTTMFTTCPNCHATSRCDRNEDGSPDLVTEPCHGDTCTAQLCPKCPQFSCYNCGLAECMEHAITDDGELWCPECVKEGAELDDEPSHDDAVLCCPDCERPNQFGQLCWECQRDRDLDDDPRCPPRE